MTNITISEAADFLKKCGNAYILIHQNPDGDCIGTGYALKAYFEATGRKSKVLCSDEIPKRFSFMLSDNSEDFTPDNIISVDVADKALFGTLADEYGDKIELSIDHHANCKLFAEKTCLNKNAAAACEVLHSIFNELGFEITRHIAICLYTGIATDTGCYQFSNANATTHRITAEIMAKFPDIDYATINRQMFAVKSIERMKMEMIAINNMEVYCNGKCTVISVTLDMLENLGVDGKDIEGIANIPLELETALIGITIKEREPQVFKISMRSCTDDINVSELCGKLGGGGHVRASGCTLKGTLEEVKKSILDVVMKGTDILEWNNSNK